MTPTSFLQRAASKLNAAVDSPDKDVRLLIKSLVRLGATLVLDKEFANKRVLVFNAPKVQTGNFPFKFYQIVEKNGVRRLRTSKAVMDSFKAMGYTHDRRFGRGQDSFIKGDYRIQLGSSAAAGPSDAQGLTLSIERFQ